MSKPRRTRPFTRARKKPPDPGLERQARSPGRLCPGLFYCAALLGRVCPGKTQRDHAAFEFSNGRGNLPGVTQTMPLAIYGALEGDFNVAITISILLVLISFGIMAIISLVTRKRGLLA